MWYSANMNMENTRREQVRIVGFGLIGMLVLPGCGIGQLRDNPWVAKVLDYAPDFMWSMTKWTVGLGLLGLPVAVGCFLALRSLGAYRWQWKHAKYLRFVAFVLVLVSTVALFGLAGMHFGALAGLGGVLESEELKEDLRTVGGAGADLVGGLYVAAPIAMDGLLDKGARARMMAAVEKELETFRKGEWELDVAEFETRLEGVTESFLETVLPALKQVISEKYPSLAEGKDEKLLDWLLVTFGERLILTIAERRLEKAGLNDPIAMAWAGLDGLASKHGDPATVTHPELAAYLPNRFLHAAVVKPARAAILGNLFGFVVIWIAIMLAVSLSFRGAEYTRARGLHQRAIARLRGRRPVPTETETTETTEQEEQPPD